MGINKLNRPGSIEKQVNAVDKTTDAVRRGLGDCGAVYIANTTTPIVGKFFAIQSLKQAQIDVSACEFNGQAGTVSGKEVDFSAGDFTIPDGATIYCNANKIALVSGYAIVYKRC